MSYEQTKSDFSEALYELFAHLIEMYKKNMQLGTKEEEKDLSDKAQKLLELFKKDPELAKEVISKFASENMEHYADRFTEFNSKALEEINNIKRNIDIKTESGKEIFNSLNMIERIQYDKQEHIKEILSKSLNLQSNIEKNMNKENENILDRQEQTQSKRIEIEIER